MSIAITYPLKKEIKQEIQKLAALGYSLQDMAMYFDFDFCEFKKEANDLNSEIYYNIKRGKLIVKANSDMKLLESAETGNITAIQQLSKILKERTFNDLLNSIGDD